MTDEREKHLLFVIEVWKDRAEKAQSRLAATLCDCEAMKHTNVALEAKALAREAMLRAALGDLLDWCSRPLNAAFDKEHDIFAAARAALETKE